MAEVIAGTAEAAPHRDKLGNYRFDGYTNEQLADQVSKLSKGTGASVLNEVVANLKDIAQDLTNTNTIIRTELGKVGIDWQSAAGQGAQDAMTSSAAYTDGAQYNITDSSGALVTQSDSHAVAASAPRPSSDNQKNVVDNVTGFFGHETDHAREVEKANEDRQMAIDQLNAYQANSQNALNGYRPLPEPPGMDLRAQGVQNTGGSTSLAGYHGGGPGYAGPSGGGFAAPGGAVPGGPGYVAPPSFSGGVPSAPLPPGVSTGVGPGFGPGSLPNTGMPAAASAANGLPAQEIGLGVAVAGGAGAVAAGANSGNSKGMVRTGGAGGGASERANTPGRASSVLGALNEEEAAQARAAAKISPQSKPGTSMMQPAAEGKGKKKEEDEEHVRKYAVEADDLFGDQRMVAPPVLGEDPSA
jgi:hypothetical protein